ncbi:hypothetical protein EDB19DRAFT_172935 [Suillus lakei]|nr:hypothetical protein EDB19DRAFT_172935 [Suillus lakei]
MCQTSPITSNFSLLLDQPSSVPQDQHILLSCSPSPVAPAATTFNPAKSLSPPYYPSPCFYSYFCTPSQVQHGSTEHERPAQHSNCDRQSQVVRHYSRPRVLITGSLWRVHMWGGNVLASGLLVMCFCVIFLACFTSSYNALDVSYAPTIQIYIDQEPTCTNHNSSLGGRHWLTSELLSNLESYGRVVSLLHSILLS